ncbi:hypothetical protein GRAN_1163 [Granulicella sibirica]|uniref:Uncharacterized protein n=1 Tax=Granulicella sibirica TaxID=2479048 RepID=A0A4Q0T2L7_9BACT|nr:hypothetical protein GRAN_1163 [Granulicella sibirica]
MSDLLSIAGTIALFLISILYLRGCDLLTRSRKPLPNA